MSAGNGKHTSWTWESGNPPPEHLSTEELANYWRVNVSFVHHRTGEESQLPHIRLSKKSLLFIKSEVDAWMNARRVRAVGGES